LKEDVYRRKFVRMSKELSLSVCTSYILVFIEPSGMWIHQQRMGQKAMESSMTNTEWIGILQKSLS
jgi:hypothetical protein